MREGWLGEPGTSVEFDGFSLAENDGTGQAGGLEGGTWLAVP